MIKLIVWDLFGVLYKNGRIALRAEEIIEKIKSFGIQNCCISNLPAQTVYEIGKKLNLNPIISSAELKMSKTNRKVYEFLLDKTGFESNQCLMIDDNAENLKIPKKMGMTVVLFGDQAENFEVDYKINELNEILQIIKKNNSYGFN